MPKMAANKNMTRGDCEFLFSKKVGICKWFNNK